MAGGGSKVAVFTAITANAVVAVAKFVGFALTGSGSMLAEAIHSVADVGNQALLAIGMRQAHKAPDKRYPYGYGREAFVWSLISAVGMFFLGCGFSIMHGIEALADEHPHTFEGGGIALGILAFALLIEGASMVVAIKSLWDDARKRDMGLVQHLITTDDPFGIAVLLEDGAAVLGVVMAFMAIGLSELSGASYWDPIGSIAIGVLLGLVAVFLIVKNRTLLVGPAISDADLEVVQQVLNSDPAVEGVVRTRGLVTGTDTVRVSTKLDFDGHFLARRYLEGTSLDEVRARVGQSDDELASFLGDYGEAIVEIVGDEVDRIEARLRAELPHARHIDVEPS